MSPSYLVFPRETVLIVTVAAFLNYYFQFVGKISEWIKHMETNTKDQFRLSNNEKMIHKMPCVLLNFKRLGVHFPFLRTSHISVAFPEWKMHPFIIKIRYFYPWNLLICRKHKCHVFFLLDVTKAIFLIQNENKIRFFFPRWRLANHLAYIHLK